MIVRGSCGNYRSISREDWANSYDERFNICSQSGTTLGGRADTLEVVVDSRDHQLYAETHPDCRRLFSCVHECDQQSIHEILESIVLAAHKR